VKEWLRVIWCGLHGHGDIELKAYGRCMGGWCERCGAFVIIP
jgi:hypothetical protein